MVLPYPLLGQFDTPREGLLADAESSWLVDVADLLVDVHRHRDPALGHQLLRTTGVGNQVVLGQSQGDRHRDVGQG